MYKKSDKPEYDIEDMKRYMALPVHKKFEYLEKMIIFLDKITPAKSKKVWNKLKSTGKV